MAELGPRWTSPVEARGLARRDDARAFFFFESDRRNATRAEIIASIPAAEEVLAVSRGALHRPVPGARHVPSTGRLKVVQAHQSGGRPTGGATAATRCCSGSTGPAWARKEDLDPLPCNMLGGGREARITASSAGSLNPVSHAGRSAGPGVLASEGVDPSGNRSSSTCGKVLPATTAIREVKGAPQLPGSQPVGKRPGHWDTTSATQHVHEPEGGKPATTRSSR